jgi:hypothetical protein
MITRRILLKLKYLSSCFSLIFIKKINGNMLNKNRNPYRKMETRFILLNVFKKTASIDGLI